MRRTLLVALTCVAFAAAPAGSPLARQSDISDERVKIGVLTDLSGLYSDGAGSGSLLAVQMAIEDFKSHFKPDFKIEMIFADHQNKADIAAAKARQWSDAQGVDAIVDL